MLFICNNSETLCFVCTNFKFTIGHPVDNITETIPDLVNKVISIWGSQSKTYFKGAMPILCLDLAHILCFASLVVPKILAYTMTLRWSGDTSD